MIPGGLAQQTRFVAKLIHECLCLPYAVGVVEGKLRALLEACVDIRRREGATRGLHAEPRSHVTATARSPPLLRDVVQQVDRIDLRKLGCTGVLAVGQ